VVSVLVGVRSVAELDEDLDLFQHSIPDALWATLLDEGLLDAGR
jgi:aryl-alcohol dehydrogenase-like predicted oxidoreductase